MAPNRKTNIEQENCATDEENSSENRVSKWRKGHESLDSIPSMISDSLPVSGGPSSLIGLTASHVSEQMTRMCLDPDFSPDEVEEKARLISQVSYTNFLLNMNLNNTNFTKAGFQNRPSACITRKA